MTEVGAEDADVEAAAIAEANDGLGIELVSDTDARRERLVGIVDIAVESDVAVAGDADDALVEVGETALALTVDVFGIVDFPAQAVVKGQLGADAPGVLTVEEPALLALSCVQAGADETLEFVYVAEQEGAEHQAAVAGERSAVLVEVELTGAVRVGRYTEVHRVTNVGAELELMVALDLGPVVDELELLFALGERAVAAADVEAVAKVRQAFLLSGAAVAAVDCREERGQAAGLGGAEVHSGNAERGHRVAARIGIGGLRIVLEVSEAEVGQQVGADRFVEAGGQAVVVNGGLAVEAAGPEAETAERTEAAFAVQIEVIQAEAAEDLKAMRRVVIDAGVEGVLVEIARTGANEVVRQRGVLRRGKFSQDRSGLRRDHADGNHVVDESGAASAGKVVPGVRIVNLTTARNVAEILAEVAEARGGAGAVCGRVASAEDLGRRDCLLV